MPGITLNLTWPGRHAGQTTTAEAAAVAATVPVAPAVAALGQPAQAPRAGYGGTTSPTHPPLSSSPDSAVLASESRALTTSPLHATAYPLATRDLVVPELGTVGCIIPAYNEGATIAGTLDSLLEQSRPPESIYVIVNNSTDDTFWQAKRYEGSHVTLHQDTEHVVEVHVVDIGKNSAKKVGALNKGWELAREHDFIFGVDGDVRLDQRCLEYLRAEMMDDSRIGGISAIYSIDAHQASGPMAWFLLSAQRNQFAGFNMDNLLRNRNMAVLGGQASLFRGRALDALMSRYHQSHPWTTDSEVEDSLLSLQVRDVGFSTKISALARAYVGGMATGASLYAQQVKWTAGGIELMRQRPFHPNLRLRWRENIAMLFNIIVRIMFALLLAGSLAMAAFAPHPIWLVPPITALALNLRITAAMKDRTWRDWLFAGLFFPTEAYMWMRGLYFVVSWWQVMNKVEKDNWSAQAKAESGGGSAGWIWVVLGIGAIGGLAWFTWTNLSDAVRSDLLTWGWLSLAILSILLTLGMLKKLVRKHRGFHA
ncbi:glycosyltransferase family 2 protein [Bogoriella caseilytica]|uniref:Cellulose synthase/poly-beta-1,6-N-acetylglucosamine synthase-like glycosyltransferase n=1 Tax=Bogoriella caseilytica TaxID=56055 RepID=A0A3N2BBJ1_9MICO|nr:glycosyltransferase family 2 protein [Bogoriella caseilytica]ROR72542.1 cellulose synthase/poly-beta-1,6-N-acetylglucosamine synthase-like glycosyltransferase [Bogoriella caseilytica]